MIAPEDDDGVVAQSQAIQGVEDRPNCSSMKLVQA